MCEETDSRNWCLRAKTMAIPFLTRFVLASGCVLLLGTDPTALTQNRVRDEPAGTACEREIRKVGGHRLGERFTAPMITRRVRPAYPKIPDGTTRSEEHTSELQSPC